MALAILAAPDPDSKTKTNEGRRIAAVDGGWHLLNYAAYRERRSNGAGGDAAACYVYYAVDGDRVKIGSSKNPWARAVTLRRELERPELKIEAVERGGYELEFNRHEQFSEERIQGEWFRMSDSLRAHIERLPRRHPRLTTVAKKVGRLATSKLSGRYANDEDKDKEVDTDTTKAKDPRAVRIFTRYKELFPDSRISFKSASKTIQRAPKQYSEDELVEAIEGNAADPWHRDRGKHELSYVLRNEEKIEYFRAMKRQQSHPKLVGIGGDLTSDELEQMGIRL